MDENAPKPLVLRSGIHLLPNILTAANLAVGFYAMTAAIREQWAVAGWCILISILFDMLDGRVARWTKSQSTFGMEFDSMADIIAFGVTPAIIMHQFVLQDYGRMGFGIALLYVICAALRLARFNVKSLSGEGPSPYFIGLPTPAAAGILASFLIVYEIWAQGSSARTIQLVMRQVPAFYKLLPGIIVALALLMVSGLRYSSFKKTNLFKPRSMRAFLITVLVILMIYVYPQNTLFVIFIGYICSGILEFIWRMYRLRALRAKATSAG
jgi:CDP-diacylglycerol---serine O-phosphatidyltransferase